MTTRANGMAKAGWRGRAWWAFIPVMASACSGREEPQNTGDPSSMSSVAGRMLSTTAASTVTLTTTLSGASVATVTSAAETSASTSQSTTAATLSSSGGGNVTSASTGDTSSASGSTTGLGGSPATASTSSVVGAGGSGGTGSVNPANCTASKLTSGDASRTVDVAGVTRSYVLHVPESYDGTTPVPLVFDFHGLGGNGMQQASSSGYRQVADREGFLIAFPDGTENAWNIGQCCTNSKEIDDVTFTRAMLESIASDGCVDLARVYVTGFSNGGGMAYLLACEAADVIAAAAPAAFDMLDPEDPVCSPSRPIAVLSSRGTNDTAVPYGGGRGSGNRVTFLGAEQSLARWS
ncbi:MAG TPA: PHB depolymerase family esterase, partial [Polyangiaceae bacterium]|nr:PHB depolymerase family esterase [Polyangiaceae bacterium]